MMLKAINPAIDSKIKLYLSLSGSVCSVATRQEISCTIIGSYNAPRTSPFHKTPGPVALYLVGWNKGETAPSNDSRIHPTSIVQGRSGTGAQFTFSKSYLQYEKCMWVPADYEFETFPSGQDCLNTLKIAQTINDKREGKCKNKTCGATNFITDAKCWNCGTLNPVS